MSADLARGEQATQPVMKGKGETEITNCVYASLPNKNTVPARQKAATFLQARHSLTGKQNVSRGVRWGNVQREAQKAQVVL